jgi:hypothetical protein
MSTRLDRTPAQAAAQALVDGLAVLWPRAVSEGPMAAAEAAWHPGSRFETAADLADEIRERIAETRQKAGAA